MLSATGCLFFLILLMLPGGKQIHMQSPSTSLQLSLQVNHATPSLGYSHTSIISVIQNGQELVA